MPQPRFADTTKLLLNGDGAGDLRPSDGCPSSGGEGKGLPPSSPKPSQKAPCHCCPYGYHIDLDFVRYCESLAKGSTDSPTKQMRRERRRQRQSMEVLLGLTSPSVWHLEQQLPKVFQEQVVTSNPDPSKTSAIARDALHKAVQDFEETLERSHKKRDGALHTDSLTPHNESLNSTSKTDGTPNALRRTDSTSSVSSMSTVSSLVVTVHPSIHHITDIAIGQDSDVASIGSAASGLSTGTLQNIREQMAVSLEKMKEMEDKVKQIPILQVQLSVLKEEKRLLLLQLKANQTNKKQMIITDIDDDANKGLESLGETGVATPRNQKKTVRICHLDSSQPTINNSVTLRSLGISSNHGVDGRARSDSYSEDLAVDKDHPVPINGNQKNGVIIARKVSSRDVGVGCSVLTRDIGITHLSPKLRSLGTMVDPKLIDPPSASKFSAKKLEFSKVTSESIPADSSLQPRDNAYAGFVKSSPVLARLSQPQAAPPTLTFDNSTNTESPSRRQIWTNTELCMESVYSPQELECSIRHAIASYQRSVEHSRPKRLDFGIQVSIQDQSFPSIPVLQIVERKDIGIQAGAVEIVKPKRVDNGVNVKPRCSDVASEAKARIRDVAAGECSISDVLCDKCNVKKRTVGVGYHSVRSSSTESLSVQAPGMTRSKSFEYSNSPIKVRTRTVGCGTAGFSRGPTASSKSTDTSDLSKKLKDVSVNTMKRKLVDAAVGEHVKVKDAEVMAKEPTVATRPSTLNVPRSPTDPNLRVTVCDKCNRAIQTMAKDIIKGKSEVSPSQLQPSRIPRPTTSTSPGTPHYHGPSQISRTKSPDARRQFVRQETYTKISPDVLAEASQKSIPNEQPEKRPGTSAARKKSPSVSNPPSDADSDEGSFNGPAERAEHSDDELPNSHSLPQTALFQPIHEDTRKKAQPTKEMKAALKVLNDSLQKTSTRTIQLDSATNIIQKEWFKISSTVSANPLDVEDYLDFFEGISYQLLEYVVNMTDVSGNTAMHYAVSHGNFDVVSILLDSKVCNINRPNQAGYTCVMLVSLAQVRSETDRQVVRRLFQLADVNVRAKQHGQTALMLAVSHGRLDMVKLLLEAGADINIQDEDGSTALMCAAEHGHVEIVKHLLAQPDCDASITDHDGSTALNIAMEAGHRDVGVLLYAHEHFSRGSSPYGSLRLRRSRNTTPTFRSAVTPPPRTPTSPSPIRARQEQSL